MITVQFRDTFRERLPEWVTSATLVFWGLIVLTETSDLWTQQYFSVLANIAEQRTWGMITLILGSLRLVALAVNGIWRPTAHIRALGAMCGMLVWTAIILSYIALPWNPPALATKSALWVLDLSALWFAAGDAKVADTLAKKQAASLVPRPSV